MIPNILLIAGFDPSGGAGIQAILACGGYATAAITALMVPWADVMTLATASIPRRPHGSIVEAIGRKVLPISAQSCAWRVQGRGLQVAEMSKEYANERNCAWFVRHGS